MNKITALTLSGFAARVPEPGIDPEGKTVLKLDVYYPVSVLNRDGSVSEEKRFLPQITFSGPLASRVKNVQVGDKIEVTGKPREILRNIRGEKIASLIIEATDFSLLTRAKTKSKSSDRQRNSDSFEIGR